MSAPLQCAFPYNTDTHTGNAALTIKRPIPYEADSSLYFERIRALGNAVYLDSGRPLSPYGRFDIIAAAPADILTFEYTEKTDNDPFAQLREVAKRYHINASPHPDLPFCGGLIGHFSYDLGRALETLPSHALKDTQYPDMQVGVYLWALIVDHQLKCCTLVATENVDTLMLDQIEAHLIKPSDTKTHSFRLKHAFKSNVSEERYHQALHQIDDYIHAGDCYQVNFAQRFSSEYSGDPWQAYLKLRQAAPTPYSAYIESNRGAILSLSPEQFLEIKNNQVTSKPIKGTRPRASDSTQDAALKAELRDSTKDRAENLMIVDLLRNDLGKVCEYGSVRVPEIFAVESYRNVHHLVTTVTGKLDPHYSAIDLLEQCFPGGSITGAPKIRAMEIIDELEPHRRSIYCGSIGYISFCGTMDTSITIRTLLCENNQIHCWAGGGIVADSISDMEYEETYNKVNNLLQTLEDTL
ncbi:MAG: aminodeoxychorismate synthase component I [Pontibacterium sp.]